MDYKSNEINLKDAENLNHLNLGGSLLQQTCLYYSSAKPEKEESTVVESTAVKQVIAFGSFFIFSIYQ